MEPKTDPLELPPSLRAEKPTTKLLWLYLKPLGTVRLSHHDLADALSIERYGVTNALSRLEDLELLRYVEKPTKAKATFRAVDPREDGQC